MTMVTVQTANLTGPALAWAVAQVEGIPVLVPNLPVRLIRYLIARNDGGDQAYHPESDGKEGVRLITKYQISLIAPGPASPGWKAQLSARGRAGFQGDATGSGPDPLYAAMRCLVAGRFGLRLAIPEKLVEATWGHC